MMPDRLFGTLTSAPATTNLSTHHKLQDVPTNLSPYKTEQSTTARHSFVWKLCDSERTFARAACV